MAFDEIQFPTSVSYGSSGGPRRLTQVVSLKSGFEERNQSWIYSRHEYDAGMGLRELKHIEQVLAFWEARSGALYGFRWKDWSDFKSGGIASPVACTDQLLGVGNGSNKVFQLTKRYISGAREYARPINKPVAGTVLLGLNGVNQLTGWTVDTTTGIVTFGTAPGSGVSVTAGFEFDVPSRFADESLSISLEGWQAGAVQSIRIIEIRV
jgi:uncharacterized protein (TIGR02217 family)